MYFNSATWFEGFETIYMYCILKVENFCFGFGIVIYYYSVYLVKKFITYVIAL